MKKATWTGHKRAQKPNNKTVTSASSSTHRVHGSSGQSRRRPSELDPTSERGDRSIEAAEVHHLSQIQESCIVREIMRDKQRNGKKIKKKRGRARCVNKSNIDERRENESTGWGQESGASKSEYAEVCEQARGAGAGARLGGGG